MTVTNGMAPESPQTAPILQALGISKTLSRSQGTSRCIGQFARRRGACSGAGKSTLIKLLTGVYQSDAGQLLHRGEPVPFANPRAAQDAGISTIYQEVNLVPLQSGARNLYLGREPRTALRLVD